LNTWWRITAGLVNRHKGTQVVVDINGIGLGLRSSTLVTLHRINILLSTYVNSSDGFGDSRADVLGEVDQLVEYVLGL
jgi:hypothetical protein